MVHFHNPIFMKKKVPKPPPLFISLSVVLREYIEATSSTQKSHETRCNQSSKIETGEALSISSRHIQTTSAVNLLFLQ
jgi:hypothetical protein